MNQSLDRRRFLLATALASIASFLAGCSALGGKLTENGFAILERQSGGRLGVYAVNTGNGTHVGYREHERFPFCSTFKVLLAGALLSREAQEGGLLAQRVIYGRNDLVTYSPVTAVHVENGMTVSELCSAALQYSDNTAGNLLIRTLGGTDKVTAFAHSIGDEEFRLDRWETQLNSALPGDPRDTSTPMAMAHDLQQLVLGDVLPDAQRTLLREWMLGNTTGAMRIRAGVPVEWRVADKTGSGDYGTSNDIAVLWPPGRAPIVMVVYYTQDSPVAAWRNDVIASAARLAVTALNN